MQLDQATTIAEQIKAQLAPHCDRIEIAGSIRRRKPDVGDIEIVAIPKPYGVGLFASGIAPIVDAWPKVRGELPCKYTQRTLPDGIALDLFFATRENWGLIFAIRTGCADYSHHVLACGWVRNGYKSAGGMLTRDGVAVAVPEERDLFRLAGVPWVEPEARSLHSPNAKAEVIVVPPKPPSFCYAEKLKGLRAMDCESYLILARIGHPAERHLVARDDAVGLTDAKRCANSLRKKHPKAKVEIFWCSGSARILENA